MAMRMRAMRRKTKIKTLKRRRTVLETVELEGGVLTISKASGFLVPKKLVPANKFGPFYNMSL